MSATSFILSSGPNGTTRPRASTIRTFTSIVIGITHHQPSRMNATFSCSERIPTLRLLLEELVTKALRFSGHRISVALIHLRGRMNLQGLSNGMEAILQTRPQRVVEQYSTMTMSSIVILLRGNFCSTQHTGMPDSESWMLAIHLLSLTHLAFHGRRIMRLDDGWAARQQAMDGTAPRVAAMPG